MNKCQIYKLLVSLVFPLGLGAKAGMFTAGAVPEWYATLYTPTFNPPNWLFSPVWTALFLNRNKLSKINYDKKRKRTMAYH